MSSEQQERMAVQYAERSLLFTVKSLLKILEWSRRQALAQDSAYTKRKVMNQLDGTTTFISHLFQIIQVYYLHD